MVWGEHGKAHHEGHQEVLKVWYLNGTRGQSFKNQSCYIWGSKKLREGIEEEVAMLSGSIRVTPTASTTV